MNDDVLIEKIGTGDHAAFAELVTRYHATLLRVARYYVANQSAAEDAVQETWIAVIRGLDRFEGRSSFKTWLFHILANHARKIGVREYRVMPVDPVTTSRFDSHGMWIDPPQPFVDPIDTRLDNAELIAAAHRAIDDLPEPQQSVVTLRDVEGLTTNEVADLLQLSSENVRVILHRGRAKIRERLEIEVGRRG